MRELLSDERAFLEALALSHFRRIPPRILSSRQDILVAFYTHLVVDCSVEGWEGFTRKGSSARERSLPLDPVPPPHVVLCHALCARARGY